MSLVLALLLALAPGDTRTETWPSGGRRAEYEVAHDDEGREEKHGPYRSWHENGELEAEGAFEHGKENGAWIFRHPDGTTAASGHYADALKSGTWETFYPGGRPESKGAWVRGARDGRWSFWREDGTKDLEASGIHKIEVYRSKEDARVYRGYIVDNLRQGPWTSLWPDASVQFEGSFRAGAREGPWVFHHPDGTPSTLLLSGNYAKGAWVGPLAGPEPPPFDAARFPALEPSPRGLPPQAEDLVVALRAALTIRALGPELAASLEALGPPALPVALELARKLDPERAADRRTLGFLEDQVLRRLCAGHVLSRHGAAGPGDAPAARELLRAWLSLWILTRGDLDFWERTVPGLAQRGPALPGNLRDLLQDPPLLERDRRYAPEAPAAETSASAPVPAAYRLRFGKAKEERLRHAVTGTKECVPRALDWLAAHQHPDGLWSNADFASECRRRGKEECGGAGSVNYDVGATGLALLALLGDGHTPTEGAHREPVLRGLAWLVRTQAGEGLIGTRDAHDFLYGHALATAALCEGYGLGAEALREPAVRALAFLELGRHPEGAWRYDVPATDPGDTSVTGWAVGALLAGSHAGLAIEASALAGALDWIERMTETSSARVGYSDRGELSARNSSNLDFPRHLGEAMTGVGLLLRLQLGQRPATTPILDAHAKLLAASPPRIDRQWGGDQYAWYYATYALHEFGAPYQDPWESELRKAVVLTQARRGDESGSWDPIGPWGAAMGRVCATALMALTLECPYRYPRALEAR